MLVISKFGIADYVDRTKVTVCWSLTDSFWIKMFFVCTISVFFLLPFIALAILYVIIAKHLMAKPGIATSAGGSGNTSHGSGGNNTSHGSGGNSAALRYRRQVILMLGTVVFTFFFFLLPYKALIVWIILLPDEFQLLNLYGYENYYKTVSFCRFMLYINSAVNPILYNLMSSKFRDGFRKLCGLKADNNGGSCCFCCCETRLGRKGTVTTTTTTTNNNNNTNTNGTGTTSSGSQRTTQDTPPSSVHRHQHRRNDEDDDGNHFGRKRSSLLTRAEVIKADVVGNQGAAAGLMKKLSIATSIVRLQENYV